MRKKTVLFLSVLLLAGLLLACLSEDEIEEEVTATPDTTVTRAARPTPQPDSTAPTWLIMLYLNADDEVLEKDIFTDLNEAEMVGSTDQMTIVAQLDRFKGGFKGDGNWKTAKRFLVTQDDDLTKIASTEIEDLGEVDSGDPQTLIDFAVWAIETYPAERYVLIMSDHGAGWMGGWNDDAPVEGSSLSINEIDQALAEIVERAGIGQFELVGFDACLMAQVEAISTLAPLARYAVASEEVEPSLGWAYASFLGDLAENPAMSGADLARRIVASYIVHDGRITDDRARRSFAEENDLDENISAGEIVQELSIDITLTAIDLSKIKDLNRALNNLALALAEADPDAVAEARAYAQSFESVFGDDAEPSYIDLGHFADMLADSLDDRKVLAAIKQVQQALKQTVIAEKHGDDRPGATGLSLFFPDSTVFEMTTDPDEEANYTGYAGRFATASLWDDFLLYYYVGDEFDASMADLDVLDAAAAKPPAGKKRSKEAPIKAPGAGQLSIAPLTASTHQVKPDGVVTLSTEITGKNVGYIYLYTLYYDEESDSFLVANIDFIAADQTRQVNGVWYPDWGKEGRIELEVDWEPTIYTLSDGDATHDEFACFEPQTYGLKEEDDVYTVRGLYTFAESGTRRGAVLQFNGQGRMIGLLVFMNPNGSGAPRKMTPNSGDRFTIWEQWLEYGINPAGELVDYEGGSMTFSGKTLEWVAYEGYIGEYRVGIVVQDLDGNTVSEFVAVTVME